MDGEKSWFVPVTSIARDVINVSIKIFFIQHIINLGYAVRT